MFSFIPSRQSDFDHCYQPLERFWPWLGGGLLALLLLFQIPSLFQKIRIYEQTKNELQKASLFEKSLHHTLIKMSENAQTHWVLSPSQLLIELIQKGEPETLMHTLLSNESLGDFFESPSFTLEIEPSPKQSSLKRVISFRLPGKGFELPKDFLPKQALS